MAYMIEDYIRDTMDHLPEKLTREERLVVVRAMPPAERVQDLAPEERLQGLAPEERLRGLSLEELRRLRAYLDGLQ